MTFAIIDLGSNTFQLLIAENQEGRIKILLDESRASKIAQDGISDGLITEQAIDRALDVLLYFKKICDDFGVSVASTSVFGTSAIRNASNKASLIEKVFAKTGFSINVIAGLQEAMYIYEGVRFSGILDLQTSLIMDIGGGSVEFILCNKNRIFWKQSFEIGGQRLMDLFMTQDPMPAQQINKLYNYLDEQLLALTNAVHQYQPVALVGSAGSFETLIDLFYMQTFKYLPNEDEIVFELPLTSFKISFEALLTKNREERLAMPGMKEFRADMIVVGVCLIDYILKKHSIAQIKVSNYALKEGVLSSMKELMTV